MLKMLEPGKTVSGKILIDNPDWKVRAVVSEKTTTDHAHDFEAGGMCTMDKSRNWLFNALREVRRLGNIKTLLIEDIWAIPSDVYREHDKRLEALWLGVSQFYALAFSDLERDLLDELLSAPLSFYNAIIGVSSEINVLNAQTIRESAKFVFMVAYDEESFIFSGEPIFLDCEEWR